VYRYTRLRADRRALNVSGTSRGSRTAISGGSNRFNATGIRAVGIRAVVRKFTTWPVAWTPASVRPAAVTVTG
jgi:hypothetical protein